MSLYLTVLGFLPIPPNFTTVGKPQITVNQYDSPLDVYSDDTLEEMKEERLVMQNPDGAERMTKVTKLKFGKHYNYLVKNYKIHIAI